jgi:hypothetical protein
MLCPELSNRLCDLNLPHVQPIEPYIQAVASIYDEFQEHVSIPKLAKALYELANTHPYQAEGAGTKIQNGGQYGGDKAEDEVRKEIWTE